MKDQDLDLLDIQNQKNIRLIATQPAQPLAGLLQKLQPFQVFTLLDMQRLFPSSIYLCANRLRTLQKDILQNQNTNNSYLPPIPEHQEYWEETLKGVREQANHIGLRRTLERLGRWDNHEPTYYPSRSTVLNEARELDLAIMSDLGDYTFFFIPDTLAKYYEQDDLFGIATQFPDANAEIQLAGNCYATGNYTACVFHLMRAVEIGARVMAQNIKAQKHIVTPVFHKGAKIMKPKPIELCDWKTLIDGLDKALEALRHGTKTSERKKQTVTFYSHAIAQFSYFKDAWRNNISHTNEVAPNRKQYLEGETLDIITNTKHFMRHLAKRLKEPKGTYADK